MTRTARFGIGIARCGSIYGDGELDWDRIVPGIIRSPFRGERPVIRSDGALCLDHLFVDDAVNGYLALGKAPMSGREYGQAFNFGRGEAVLAFHVLQGVGRAVGRLDLALIVQSDAPDEIPAQWLDATEAWTRLDWASAFTLQEGLGSAAKCYREVLA